MHPDESPILGRVKRMVRERVLPNVVRRSAPVSIEAWLAPDEPVPFAEAVAQEFQPFAIGEPWAAPWGTAWLRVRGTIPADFGAAPGTSVELHVDLGWDENAVGFNAEGLAWRPDGSTIKGIHPENFAVPIDAAPGESFELYVEAAANPNVDKSYTFQPTPLGSKRTAGEDPLYSLRGLAVVERDETVFGLQMDLQAIRGLIDELPSDLTRRADLLGALDRSADALDPDDVAGTAGDARDALAGVLAVRASESAHRAVAVGHSHIDSAWLWPVRETIRKCARTWSNVLDMMDRDPDFTFAASSAQQYAWIRDSYPEIFERIRTRVAEGRWIPVGSMWVESDTNLPGGEALARQFVAGKRFFLEEFGLETTDAWLPDSFGYTAALPQIVQAAGATRFLTQKPSWNDTNKLPHSSFQWEGIDGSRVITHCPPVDLYNARMSPAEVRRGERNNKERGVVDTSMLLYGFGDGGGGPTREMLALARRQSDLDGSPRVDLGRPDDVWEDIEAALPDLPVWAGEMYLEFHRGTCSVKLNCGPVWPLYTPELPTPMTSSKRPGTSCCCNSSTTFFRAPRSPGCMRWPRPTTPRLRRPLRASSLRHCERWRARGARP